MDRKVICAAVAVLASSRLVVAGGGEIDLQRALELARDRNRAVRVARATAAAESARLQAARAQRLPSLVVRQRITRLDRKTVARANAAADGLSRLIGFEIPPFVYRDGYRTEAEVQVPLWTSGGLEASVDGQRGISEAATADQAGSLRQAAIDVVDAFFGVVATEEVVRARRRAASRSERRLQEVERRLEVGLAARHEVLRWRVEVERARSDLAATDGDRLVARLTLASLLDIGLRELGSPRPPGDEVVEELLAWADGLDPLEILDGAAASLESLPEVRAAQARARATEADRRRARSALLPRLDGSFAYGWLENDSAELDEFADWAASLVISVPVDVRGDLRSDLRAAEARSTAAEVAVAEARSMLEVELGRNLMGVITARTRVRSARRALQEARARRELVARQQEVGLTGLLDLIDADTTLVTSDVDLAVARADFLGAVARLQLGWAEADPPGGGLIR